MIMVEQKRGRGKPSGTRQHPELYQEIRNKLWDDRRSKGTGMTAFAISKAIAYPYPTVQQYLDDMLKDGEVKIQRVASMTLFSIKVSAKTTKQ